MDPTAVDPVTRLGHIAEWLLTLRHENPDRLRFLSQTPDYQELIRVAERLECAFPQTHHSFLQHEVASELLTKIFDFLDASTLVQVSATCVRWRQWAQQSAVNRTRKFVQQRQLNNVMQLVRAQEQLQCVAPSHHSVRVPLLMLSKRIQISNAGDPDYNGIYHCTGCNGNGFVFSKPRDPIQRGRRRRQRDGSSDASRTDEEESFVDDDLPLRCIIAKKYSSEVSFFA